MAEYVVRYGAMRLLGVFRAPEGQTFPRSAAVIVRTDRGLETGVVLCPASPEARATLKSPVEGPILRAMTAEDHLEEQRLREQAEREREVCRRHVERLGLEMKLVMVEHIFGGERIIVYYLAESRVDFRELVRVLANEFQTRIEMRQIGVRDEAKLLGDYSDCGQPLCCNTHLVQMPPVSMKMAKLQKATLDPTKISGRCGRLKCCLRYEYELYEELHKQAARQARAEAASGAMPADADSEEPSDRRPTRNAVPAAQKARGPSGGGKPRKQGAVEDTDRPAASERGSEHVSAEPRSGSTSEAAETNDTNANVHDGPADVRWPNGFEEPAGLIEDSQASRPPDASFDSESPSVPEKEIQPPAERAGDP